MQNLGTPLLEEYAVNNNHAALTEAVWPKFAVQVFGVSQHPRLEEMAEM